MKKIGIFTFLILAFSCNPLGELKRTDNSFCAGAEITDDDYCKVFELDPSWTPKYSNLVAYWRLDNSFKDSIGDSNGTPNGAMAFSTDAKVGTHSAVFNGTSSYINAGNSPSLHILGDTAVQAWIKTGAGATNYIVSKYAGSGTGDAGILLFKLADGRAGFAGRDGSNNYRDIRSTTLIDDNEWHHLVGQRVGGTWYLYIDGVEEAELVTNYLPTNVETNNNFQIGALNSLFFYSGLIDEVAVWNTSLTPRQIEDLYIRQSEIYK